MIPVPERVVIFLAIGIIVSGVAIGVLPRDRGHPVIAVVEGDLPYTELVIYQSYDTILGARNEIGIVVWAYLNTNTVDEVIKRVVVRFPGSWQAPVDFGNEPAKAEITLVYRPDKGMNVFRGEGRIVYPAGGNYPVELFVQSSDRSYEVRSSNISPPILVASAQNFITIKDNQRILGVTWIFIGITILTSGWLHARQMPKDFSKEERTEP